MSKKWIYKINSYFHLSYCNTSGTQKKEEKKKRKRKLYWHVVILILIIIPKSNLNLAINFTGDFFVKILGPCAHLLFFFFAYMFILSQNFFIFYRNFILIIDHIFIFNRDNSHIYINNVMVLWFTWDIWHIQSFTEGEKRQVLKRQTF